MSAQERAEALAASGGGPGGEGEGGEGGGYVEEVYVPPVSKPWPEKSDTWEATMADITEEAVVPTRERFVLSLQRRRKEFRAAYRFSDRDAAEDPNVTANDCRPYKDPNFATSRREHHAAVQAVPVGAEQQTQTTWFRPVNKTVQYTPVGMGKRDMMKQLDSAGMRSFLAAIRPRYEEALQQNETVDIFSDDFADLAEEEASLGNKTDSEFKEIQSYQHLLYSVGRLLTHIQWHPKDKGVVAVTGVKRLSFDERVAVAGKVQTGYILLWTFANQIHPQYVLEAPGDVHCFRFAPSNVDMVIGGLETGQVCVWDLAAARAAAREKRQLNDDTSDEGGANTIYASPIVLSAVDTSHKRPSSTSSGCPPRWR